MVGDVDMQPGSVVPDRDAAIVREMGETPAADAASPLAAPVAAAAASLGPIHPLMSKWTLWFDTPAQGKQQHSKESDWTTKIKEVFTFDTAEDFWRLMNNVKEPSQVPISSNYHLFRAGVQPAWEDVMNANGGRWRFEVKNQPAEFDNLWRFLTATLVGESFDHSDDVCGVVASPRKHGQRISIWLKDASAASEDRFMSIGRALKAGIKFAGPMDFEPHHKTTNPAKYNL